MNESAVKIQSDEVQDSEWSPDTVKQEIDIGPTQLQYMDIFYKAVPKKLVKIEDQDWSHSVEKVVCKEETKIELVRMDKPWSAVDEKGLYKIVEEVMVEPWQVEDETTDAAGSETDIGPTQLTRSNVQAEPANKNSIIVRGRAKRKSGNRNCKKNKICSVKRKTCTVQPKIHVGQESDTNNEAQATKSGEYGAEEEDSIKKHYCSICNEHFNFISQLLNHMLMHSNTSLQNPIKNEVTIEKKNKYSCSVCNKVFDLPRSLKRHTRNHTGEKIHACSICNKMFKETSQLNRHMQIHTGGKPRECTLCNKRFTDNNGLAVHMRTHTGEKPYECSVCNKKFTTNSDLKKHLMMTHTKEKPHACSVCQKRYTQKGDLKVHMMIHTGERPHECSICKKKFTHKSSLRPHMLTHTREKPYKCPYCDKAFTQRRSLKLHKSNHEKEQNSCNSLETDLEK